MLFFAGPVPPPFPAFVFCSSIAFIGGIAARIAVGALVVYPGPFSFAGGLGLLLTISKISYHFFVPTLGLAFSFGYFKLWVSPLLGSISAPTYRAAYPQGSCNAAC